MEFIINDIDESIRLDKYLMSKLDISRTKVQEMIKEDLIKVNGKMVKSSYMLKLNDKIDIIRFIENNKEVLPENIKLDIIYEDDYLMVINKPSGMVVHPADGNYSNTLVNALLYHTDKLSNVNGELRPGIVHRIDKDTSGLLVVAKTNEAHEGLAEQLKDKTLNRKYLALVHGKINHDTGTIDAPIGRDAKDRKRMCVTPYNSKDAITHFKVLKRYNDATLLDVKLETGRTHQIRVHMKYIEHPIVNDPVYCKKSATSFGQMLHAREISFIHPITGKNMTFNADAPKEFNDILNKYEED